jgi:hypothetical protein
MVRHQWVGPSYSSHCRVCGINFTIHTNISNCPPWSFTTGGEAPKPSASLGREDLQELKEIRRLLFDSARDTHIKPVDSNNNRNSAIILLQQFIQKHEGLVRD